jgi:hypothetical protein
LWLTDRQAKRLLPLAMMLRLSLVFPDRAPSRFSSALRSGSTKALQRAVERRESLDDFVTTQKSAEHILELIGAVSKHDRLTRGHCERVRAYADLIGQQMGLDAESRGKLHWAALLHDVGKLNVPAEILNKKSRLTPDEWRIVRNHPAASERWLAPLRGWLGDWALAASQHHERWDGDGYPLGLKGDQISLAGRIVGVADAFDVMTAARSYKKPYPAAQARTELANNAGTQFDPKVVRAFLAVSLGKLRLVMGPLAWLANIPGLLSLTGAAASGATTVLTTAAVTVTGIMSSPPAKAHRAPSPVHADAPVVVRDTSSSTDDDGGTTTGDGTHGSESTTKTTTRGSTTARTRGPTSTTVRRPADGSSNTPTTGAPGIVPVTPVHDPLDDGSAIDPSSPTTVPAATPTTAAPIATTPTTDSTAHAPIAKRDIAGPILLGTHIRFDVLANDSDVDGDLDPSSLSVLTYPALTAYSDISIKDHQIDITPKTLFTGTMNLTYQICDDAGHCVSASASVTFVAAL